MSLVSKPKPSCKPGDSALRQLRLLLRLAIGLDCMTCQDFVQMKVGAEIQAFTRTIPLLG